MANIIFFKTYINAKEEERKRIKNLSLLSDKRDKLFHLLHAINGCAGCSFIIKSPGKNNQINLNEYMVDKDLLNVIMIAIKEYNKGIQDKIKALEDIGQFHHK